MKSYTFRLIGLMLYSLAFLIMTSCTEDHEGQFYFKLDLIDEKGVEKVQFPQGENVTFILRLINKTGDVVQLTNDDLCELLNQEEFLLIYLIIQNSETGEDEAVPIGKPYDYPINCNNLGGPSTILDFDPGYHDLLKYSWISELTSNVPFSPGRYKTSIKHELWDSKVPLNISTEFQVFTSD